MRTNSPAQKREDDISYLEQLLLKSPENSEDLDIKCVKVTKRSVVIEVGKGKTKWRHKIQTEEV